ncbi:MAG: RCC1 repeat-containing protein, partial [Bdellovibrionota bacterium]
MSAGNGSFYGDSSCAAGTVTTTTFATGQNSKSVYYSASQTGTVTVTAASGEITSGTASVSVLTSAIKMAAAGNLTCAVTGAGGVRCWGDDQGGSFGNGSTGLLDSTIPVDVSGLGGTATDVSVGNGFACAVVDSGAKCWGLGTSGQIGNAASATVYSPTAVSGLGSNVTQVAVGNASACAIKSGAVYCWGDNTYGNLGDNSVTNSNAPVAVTGYTGTVTRISAGTGHVCALVSDSSYCWGYNQNGQLGTGNTTSLARATQKYASGVADIAARSNNTCATMTDGSVKCWGANQDGQLADGTLTDVTSAATHPLSASGPGSVSIGASSICVQSSAGTIKCTGANRFGGLGDGSFLDSPTTPLTVSGVSSVSFLTGGGAYHCTIVGGLPYCWGLNHFGQLGDNTTLNRYQATSMASTLASFSVISTHSSHSCGLIGGVVKCWGRNSYGAIGDNTYVSKSTPTIPSGLSGGGATGVATGFDFSCAIVSGGAVSCWG